MTSKMPAVSLGRRGAELGHTTPHPAKLLQARSAFTRPCKSSPLHQSSNEARKT
jgi:hypothetical protein